MKPSGEHAGADDRGGDGPPVQESVRFQDGLAEDDECNTDEHGRRHERTRPDSHHVLIQHPRVRTWGSRDKPRRLLLSCSRRPRSPEPRRHEETVVAEQSGKKKLPQSEASSGDNAQHPRRVIDFAIAEVLREHEGDQSGDEAAEHLGGIHLRFDLVTYVGKHRPVIRCDRP